MSWIAVILCIVIGLMIGVPVGKCSVLWTLLHGDSEQVDRLIGKIYKARGDLFVVEEKDDEPHK